MFLHDAFLCVSDMAHSFFKYVGSDLWNNMFIVRDITFIPSLSWKSRVCFGYRRFLTWASSSLFVTPHGFLCLVYVLEQISAASGTGSKRKSEKGGGHDSGFKPISRGSVLGQGTHTHTHTYTHIHTYTHTHTHTYLRDWGLDLSIPSVNISVCVYVLCIIHEYICMYIYIYIYIYIYVYIYIYM